MLKKKTLMQHAILTGGLMLAPGLMMAQNDWAVSGTPDQIVIPFDAIVAGHEAPHIVRLGLPPIPGAPLYVCRGGAQEGLNAQVGKFRSDFKGCDIGFGGEELTVPDFEFLVADWYPASNGVIPTFAVVGGYDTPPPGQFQGPNLYYCRAKVAGSDLELGKIRPEFGACSIPYGGKEVFVAQYEVLVSGIPYHQVSASNGTVPPDAIRGGRDDDGTDLYVCTAFFGGGEHPGKLRASFHGCDISYGGAEHIVSSYDVVVPDWSAYPPSGQETYAFDFPAGADLGGFTLYACRAHFDNSVQPGKTRQDWSTCNFGYGGKETTDTSYDILSTPLFPPR